MRFRITQVVFAGFVILHSSTPRAIALDIDSVVQRLVKPVLEKNKKLSFVVGVITKDGKKTCSFGTIRLDGKEQPPNERTIYEIGSITKVFTGTVLAILTLEKKVRLDDPVQPWLPADWKLPRRDERDISFLHLATHTSSLPVQPPVLPMAALLSGTIDDPYSKFDSKAVAQSLKSIQLAEPIGCKHSYSNLGVGLLGHALAKADGTDSYQSLVTKRIFRPLGMADSSIELSDEQKKRLASGHDKDGEAASGWSFATLEACGGIRSSLADMLRFMEAAMAKKEGPLGGAFAFGQQPWRELAGRRNEVGLCWMRSQPSEKSLRIWHNGGTGGYASFMGFRPKSGEGVVILCNSADRMVDDLGFKLLDALEKE